MRRLATTIVALFALCAIGAGASANAQASESIHNYDVTIEIRADDSILVTEVIEYDFGSTQHHGIFRDVPTRQAYDDRYDRVYPLHSLRNIVFIAGLVVAVLAAWGCGQRLREYR